jgi:hypothetical protein
MKVGSAASGFIKYIIFLTGLLTLCASRTDPRNDLVKMQL